MIKEKRKKKKKKKERTEEQRKKKEKWRRKKKKREESEVKSCNWWVPHCVCIYKNVIITLFPKLENT